VNNYDVPCRGCTLCCHRDLVRILPQDDITNCYVKPHPRLRGAFVLDHKPNGDCIYLGDGGCTCHADKPQMCREMDCRRIARAISWTKARQMAVSGRLTMPIWRRGKDLLAGK
jgi:hypothetical protein